MKYFEIVFDNSSSMSIALADSTRLEVAKKLFLSEVLPNIDQNTLLAVRLLRDSCSGNSQYTFVGSNLNDCIEFINSIQAIGSCTPLFYTMKDALQTTLKQRVAERTIFVLTDGGDNCDKSIENVLTAEELKWFKQINVILAQFTVSGASEVNQLSHFANTIGARTFNFGTNPNAEVNTIRSEFKVELQKSGLSRNGKLSHCFEDLAGDSIKWEQIETAGYGLHQAMVLYQEGCLNWLPDVNKSVSPTQFAELKFIYGIRFASGISREVMKAMLEQLERPYYYSSNCIYWHFEEARWKYFPQPAPIVVEKEVEKIVEREVEKIVYVDRQFDRTNHELYQEGSCYMVVEPKGYDTNSLSPNIDLIPPTYVEFELRKSDCHKPKILKPGDVVRFSSGRRGRPRRK